MSKSTSAAVAKTEVAAPATETLTTNVKAKKVLSSEQIVQMDTIVQGLGENPGKSAKIRALHAAGHEKADIARYLGVIYQHVRNVLVTKTKRHAPE